MPVVPPPAAGKMSATPAATNAKWRMTNPLGPAQKSRCYHDNAPDGSFLAACLPLSARHSPTPSLRRPAVAPSAGSGRPDPIRGFPKIFTPRPVRADTISQGSVFAGGDEGFPTITITQTFPGIGSEMSTAHDSTGGGGAATSTVASLAEDRELIDLFVSRRDYAAFQALVERHAEMVLGVCRRVLQQAQDAEDAC